MRLPVLLPAAAAAAAEPVRRRCRRATSGDWGEQRVDFLGGMHVARRGLASSCGLLAGFHRSPCRGMDGWQATGRTCPDALERCGLHTEHSSAVALLWLACTLKRSSAAADLGTAYSSPVG